MDTEYQYRRHIRWMGDFIIPILAVFTAIAILVPILLTLRSTNNSTIRIGLACLVPATLYWGLLWVLTRRMSKMRVTLGEEAIVYQTHKGEQRIPYDSITKVKLPKVGYIGGWMKIASDSDDLRLTVVIENIGKFVQEFKARLDNKQLAGRYDEEKLFKFLKTAALADQSWERSYAILLKFVLLSAASAALGFALVFFAGSTVVRRPGAALAIAGFWAGGAWMWPTVVQMGTEVVFGRRIAKQSDRETFTYPARDTVYEARVYRKALIVGTALYIVLSLPIFLILIL